MDAIQNMGDIRKLKSHATQKSNEYSSCLLRMLLGSNQRKSADALMEEVAKTKRRHTEARFAYASAVYRAFVVHKQTLLQVREKAELSLFEA